jgi:hypothetical protein
VLTKPVVTEVIFDETYWQATAGNVRLEFLPDAKTLHLQWYGALSHEDHTRFAQMTLDVIGKKGARKWIGDVLHIVKPLPDDIAHYIAGTWFPAAHKAGISVFAIVMPMREQIRPSVQNIAEVLALKHGALLKTLPFKCFDSREEARQWMNP